MILLTDEEIRATFGNHKPTQEILELHMVFLNDIAKAQLKNIAEWGEEQCQEHHTSGIWFKRRECSKCWQALLEEAK